MMQMDELIQFYTLAIEEGGYAVAQRVLSEEEVGAVEEALRFHFPPSFRRFLLTCPYHDGRSLVRNNEVFHERDEDGFLPQFLILINSGHDGDCICFDSRSRGEDGEVPVVYWDAESMTEADIGTLQPLHSSFAGYLQFLTNWRIESGHAKKP